MIHWTLGIAHTFLRALGADGGYLPVVVPGNLKTYAFCGDDAIPGLLQRASSHLQFHDIRNFSLEPFSSDLWLSRFDFYTCVQVFSFVFRSTSPI